MSLVDPYLHSVPDVKLSRTHEACPQFDMLVLGCVGNILTRPTDPKRTDTFPG